MVGAIGGGMLFFLIFSISVDCSKSFHWIGFGLAWPSRGCVGEILLGFLIGN
uniref:Flocculation protein FLO11 n=1 Tax=Rhizophora mucronata TaxID=61149 RepID=A0A2P2N0X1_RHIMU